MKKSLFSILFAVTLVLIGFGPVQNVSAEDQQIEVTGASNMQTELTNHITLIDQSKFCEPYHFDEQIISMVKDESPGDILQNLKDVNYVTKEKYLINGNLDFTNSRMCNRTFFVNEHYREIILYPARA